MHLTGKLVARQAHVLVLFLLMSTACQTFSGPLHHPNPAMEIANVFTTWRDGLQSGDIAQTMSVMEEDFVYYGGPIMTLPGASGSFYYSIVNRTNFQRMARYMWNNPDFDFTETELWIQDDAAIAAPVAIGNARQAVGLVKTETGWKINRLFSAAG